MFLFVFMTGEMGVSYSPEWSQTHYVVEDALELLAGLTAILFCGARPGMEPRAPSMLGERSAH